MPTVAQSQDLLRDGFGRTARDLRISLTDRCNLRCNYCMPAEGLTWLPTPSVLTDDEVIRLITVAVERLGVRELRFTGGEPLLRGGLAGILAAAAALRTDANVAPELSLTTNGLGLDKRIDELAAAGLQRVNISLDSLDRERYATLARRDRLDDVLRGLAAVDAAGLRPIKVNTVVMRGVNEVDVVPSGGVLPPAGLPAAVHRADAAGPPARVGPSGSWCRRSEILARLRGHFDLAVAGQRGAAPAEDWLVAAADCHPAGRIGVIASVTAPVLRGLRPHPADRGRAGAQLPVQPYRDRPAHCRCGPGPVTRNWPCCGVERISTRLRATASARAGFRTAGPHDERDRRLSVKITYYAGAADAAGTTTCEITVTELTATELLTRLAEGEPAPARRASALLPAGRRHARSSDASAAIPGTARVDVLPPFAGG